MAKNKETEEIQKKILSKAIEKMRFHHQEIAKHRDALRSFYEEIETILENCNDGLDSLEDAIEKFSEQI